MENCSDEIEDIIVVFFSIYKGFCAKCLRFWCNPSI
uniref:Uncharacterized protein n=1 Tax=Phage sp. ctv3H3 TaxID=2826753 RepID=A0A8S5NBA9_9VIRU|nr:MAG TPA: Protein of unknown function (DUF1244) [Phage sp. ctv3H3]